jgi:hypothetical protein
VREAESIRPHRQSRSWGDSQGIDREYLEDPLGSEMKSSLREAVREQQGECQFHPLGDRRRKRRS